MQSVILLNVDATNASGLVEAVKAAGLSGTVRQAYSAGQGAADDADEGHQAGVNAVWTVLADRLPQGISWGAAEVEALINVIGT